MFKLSYFLIQWDFLFLTFKYRKHLKTDVSGGQFLMVKKEDDRQKVRFSDGQAFLLQPFENKTLG